MSLYTFRGLCAGYGAKKIIDGISGEIERGRITALIGPNGGGKSTLLRALGGLGSYSGALAFGHREVSGIPRRDFGRLVGFLPQNISVRAAFSVYEIISLGRLPFHGALEPMKPEDDRIILESAELAEVGHLLFRAATELSGGRTAARAVRDDTSPAAGAVPARRTDLGARPEPFAPDLLAAAEARRGGQERRRGGARPERRDLLLR